MSPSMPCLPAPTLPSATISAIWPACSVQGRDPPCAPQRMKCAYCTARGRVACCACCPTAPGIPGSVACSAWSAATLLIGWLTSWPCTVPAHRACCTVCPSCTVCPCLPHSRSCTYVLPHASTFHRASPNPRGFAGHTISTLRSSAQQNNKTNSKQRQSHSPGSWAPLQ